MDFNAALKEEGAEFLPIELVKHDLESAKAQISHYLHEIEELKVRADEIVVKTPSGEALATQDGTAAKKLAKRIDELRKQIIAEPSEFVGAVNNFCKTFTSPLKEIEDGLKKKIGDYRQRVELERRKQEEAARRAAAELQTRLEKEAAAATAKAQREAKKSGLDPADVEPIIAPQVVAPILTPEKQITRTDAGTSYQKKEWKFEVEFFDKVPDNYKVVSDQKIRDAIRMGTREIPGVRIWEQSSTIFKTN